MSSDDTTEIEILNPTNNTNEINGSKITNRHSHLRTKPLTQRQERRLVSYLDDQFLQLTRGFKKRTSSTTHVPTLHKYIHHARKLLSFILQIPPVEPSQELRTQFMLRLMGDVLSAIPGYKLVAPPPSQPNGNQVEKLEEGEEEEPRDYTSALRELLDWLDDLDQSWLAVLQSQVWDPDLGEGVDLVLPIDSERNYKSSPISQTDVTRFRSLIVTGIASLEEWLGRARTLTLSAHTHTTSTTATIGGEDDVAGMLERLGLLEEFDDLFSRTMDFLGGFSEGLVDEPEIGMGIDTIVEDEDEGMNGMVEVVMSGCS